MKTQSNFAYSNRVRHLLLYCLLFGTLTSFGQNDWQFRYHAPQGNSLTDIELIGRDTLFVVGRFGTFMRSYDGGTSWDIDHNLFGDLADLEGISTLDGKHVVVYSQAKLWRSLDGGENWEELYQLNPKIQYIRKAGIVDWDHAIYPIWRQFLVRNNDDQRSVIL